MSTSTVLRGCPKCALEEPTATFCGRSGQEIDAPARMFSRRATVALAGVAVSILLLSGALIVQAALHGPVAAVASVLALSSPSDSGPGSYGSGAPAPGIRGAHR